MRIGRRALSFAAPAFALLLAATLGAQPPHFADQAPPPAPDYALSASWAAGPAGPGASAAVPAGAIPAAKNPPADVFFIHPTTDRSKTRWSQPMDDAEVNAWTDASVIARQASVFNACCRVFAPRYRQATLLNANNERMKALAFAYRDIEAAFDYYIKHYNHGRPFIIAGHSQGGFMVAELLEKRIQGTPLQKQLVAAYSIGVNVAEGEPALRFPGTGACKTPTQTGCLLQWNSLLASADFPAMAARSEKTFTDRYGDAPGKTTLCVNPITFDAARPAAEAAEAKGAVPGDPGEGPLRPIVRGAVAARCIGGALSVTPSDALGLQPLGGVVMHYHDFGLFYEDVRENAKLRVAAFLKANRRR